MFWMKGGLKWSLIRFIGGTGLLIWIYTEDTTPLVGIILGLAIFLELIHLLKIVRSYKRK